MPTKLVRAAAPVALLALLSSCSTLLSRPTGPRLLCQRILFRPAALHRATGEEKSDDASAAALRSFIAKRQGGIPPTGWRRLGKISSRVEYGWGQPPGNLVVVGVEKKGTAWDVTAATRCVPEVIKHGLHTGSWQLAPDSPPPGPDTRQVTAFVTERECAGQSNPSKRLLPTDVKYGKDQVSLSFFIRPLPKGNYACGTNRPARVDVKLTQALGNRKLTDGGVYPPLEPGREKAELQGKK